MTLPVGPVPNGLTDMDIDAATAPLGIELWLSDTVSGVLSEVALVRDEDGYSVRWTYTDGAPDTWQLGERVGIRVNLNDLRTAR